MIASLNGRVAHIEKDNLLVEVGGVGLQVYAPHDICASTRIGEIVYLHTYLVVREDLLALYGFELREARDLFITLLGVNGIGPRLALSILSQLSPDVIRRAVFNDQPEIFSRVPGVGKKTAQKLMLHLQDKIKPTLETLEPVGLLSDIDAAVQEALTALGYSVVEAQAALQGVPREAPEDVEERLRLALQYFATP